MNDTIPTPGHGRLISFLDFKDKIELYYQNQGLSKGLTTGWIIMDQFLTLQKGQLTIITGIPSSGKSEWLDQLMLHAIALHNWHWTIFSPENWPLSHHFQKLSEKWIGKPMFKGYGVEPMAADEMVDAYDTLSGSIAFMNPPENDLTIEPILDLVRQSKEHNNTDAVLIDPWNELEHHRPKQMSETEYIGLTLTKLRNFARRKQIAIFLVAHPTKLQKKEDGTYPIPDPYDISGSANWRNKADVCISAWRDYTKDDGVVQIHIQKVRNKNLGKLGSVTLYWHKANGLFFESHEDCNHYDQHGVKKQIKIG